MNNKFSLGKVVCCYPEGVPNPFNAAPVYGVIVAVPAKDYPYYRVRISTKSFSNYVELGVEEQFLC